LLAWSIPIGGGIESVGDQPVALVGRSEELQLIAEATRAVGDHARGVVLSGAAGAGKTRLAREAFGGSGRRGARWHWIVGTTSARGVASHFGPDPSRRVREVINGTYDTIKRADELRAESS
jgi:hypothetical protein